MVQCMGGMIVSKIAGGLATAAQEETPHNDADGFFPPVLFTEEPEKAVPPLLFEMPDGTVKIGEKVRVNLTINGETKPYILEFSKETNSIFINDMEYEMICVTEKTRFLNSQEVPIYIKKIIKKGGDIIMEGKAGLIFKGSSVWTQDSMNILFGELFEMGEVEFTVIGKPRSKGFLRKKVSKSHDYRQSR